MVDAMNWSCVEVAVAIFIACIPSFNTLITHRFPKLQRLLGHPSSKEDTSTASKTYGSSSRRTYNIISLEARKGLKMGSHIGESRVDVITTLNGSQERIMHAGIQVTTDVSVNDKSV